MDTCLHSCRSRHKSRNLRKSRNPHMNYNLRNCHSRRSYHSHRTHPIGGHLLSSLGQLQQEQDPPLPLDTDMGMVGLVVERM